MTSLHDNRQNFGFLTKSCRKSLETFLTSKYDKYMIQKRNKKKTLFLRGSA